MSENSALRMEEAASFKNPKSNRDLIISRRTRYLHRLDAEYVIQARHSIILRFFQRMSKQHRDHCERKNQNHEDPRHHQITTRQKPEGRD